MVIVGVCELAPDGRLFNSAALLDGGAIRAVYRKLHLWAASYICGPQATSVGRKLHLWGEEPRWFAAGTQPAPVVATRYGRIGLAVCYDLELPELTRGLALDGAELIAVPTNWPHEESPPDGRPVLHSLAAMTAYWNKAFVAVGDRCGVERGLEFEGGSVIAGPDGGLRAGPVTGRGVQTLWADCDLGQAADKRTASPTMPSPIDGRRTTQPGSSTPEH